MKRVKGVSLYEAGEVKMMSYMVTAAVSFSALVKKNSRFIFWVFLALLWVLFVLCIDNPDYDNYKVVYDNIDNQSVLNYYYGGMANESGFRLLYKICFMFGLEYRGFLAVFALAGLGILGWCIWQYSANPNIVLVLYLIYPFTIDYVQIRSFMSMVIVLFSLQYLLDDKKISQTKYIAGVLIASTIHVSALFYLILLLIRLLTVRQCWYVSIIGIFAIVLLYSNVDLFAGLFSWLIPVNKIKSWLSGDISRSVRSIVSTIGLRVGWIGLQVYFFSRYRAKVRRGAIERDRVIEGIYKCNILLMLTLGFEIFTKSYERLGRISFVLGYILFTRLFALRRTKALPWLFVFGFMAVYFVFFMFFSEVGDLRYFEGVFQNMFENNMLFR